MKMLSIQLLHSLLEFLGFLDELGGVVQPRLQRTQLHLQVMYLRKEGREEGRRVKGGQRFDDSVTTQVPVMISDSSNVNAYLLSFL